ncbi:thioredoxin-disulfide reductase [Patescibacteria group bacterium]|nr:thioredoxin-disulfide reductase [Patescibacteria group bacterium]
MYDVIIIGSGPAGYTAAIYTSRAFLKTLLISGPQPGGQLTTTTDVENFPGFPEGILGPELLQRMKVQAERFGSEIATDIVLNLKSQISMTKQNSNSKKQTFLVQGQEKVYEAKAVIIATGASPKTFGIPSEEKFRGKGISYCATCDGFFFRGKNITVLGGGDTAMEEATFLTRFAEKVTIIHRREEFRASPIMVDRAKKNPKISFLLNAVVEEFYGDSVLQGVRIRNTTNEIQEIQFDGVFVAIGHIPATEFLKGIVELDNKGYIVTCDRLAYEYLLGSSVSQDKLDYIQKKKNRYTTMTSVEGIFAAGDCVDTRYRQGIVAAGMGCMAALDVERYLQK